MLFLSKICFHGFCCFVLHYIKAIRIDFCIDFYVVETTRVNSLMEAGNIFVRNAGNRRKKSILTTLKKCTSPQYF